MGNWGIVYDASFNELINNDVITIEIKKSGWTGDSSSLTLSGISPVIIEHDKRDNIISMKAKLNIINDFNDIFTIAKMYNEDAREYKLDLYKNGDLFFQGWLAADEFTQAIKRNGPIQLSFNNGLSNLNRFYPSFLEDTSVYFSEQQVIEECTRYTYFDNNVWVNSTLWEDNLSDDEKDKNPFLSTYVNKNVFFKNNGNYNTAKDILNKILKSFNATLYESYDGGTKYVIDREIDKDQSIIKYWTGDTSSDYVNYTPNVIDLSNVILYKSGNYTLIPAAQRFDLKLNYEICNNAITPSNAAPDNLIEYSLNNIETKVYKDELDLFDTLNWNYKNSKYYIDSDGSYRLTSSWSDDTISAQTLQNHYGTNKGNYYNAPRGKFSLRNYRTNDLHINDLFETNLIKDELGNNVLLQITEMKCDVENGRYDISFEQYIGDVGKRIESAPIPNPPDQPTNLTVKNYNTQTYIKWDANSEANINGYNVYRSYNGSSYLKVNSSLVQDVSYIDTTVIGNLPYDYKITAENIDGNESIKSINTNINRIDSLVGFGTDSRFAYGGATDPIILYVNTTSNLKTNSDSTHGSFRWAIEEPYPRIILFETSGTIDYEGVRTEIDVRNSNLWIVGQSAPSPGIEILGTTFNTYGQSDVLLEHFTVGKGDVKSDNDTILTWGNNIVLNRMTSRWGNDEVVSGHPYDTPTDKKSMIGCLTYESLSNTSYKTKDVFGHAYMFLTWKAQTSYYRNLVAFGVERSPIINQGNSKFAVINQYSVMGWLRPGPDIGGNEFDNSEAVFIGNDARRMNNDYSHSRQDYAMIIRPDTSNGALTKIYVNDLGCKRKDDGYSDDDCVYDSGRKWVNETTIPFSVDEYYIMDSSLVRDELLKTAGSKWRDEHDLRVLADVSLWNDRPYSIATNRAFTEQVSGILNSPKPLPARAVYWFSSGGNVSAGYDWATTNDSFTINASSNGTNNGTKTITLDANCTTFTAALNHVNAKLTTAGINGEVEAYNPGSDSKYICLRSKGTGLGEVIHISSGATSLQLVADTYYGENAGGHLKRHENIHTFILPKDPHGAFGIITNMEKWVIDTFSTEPENINVPEDENMIINGGGYNTTDWVDTNGNGMADNWTAFSSAAATYSIVTGSGWDGRAQRLVFDDTSGYRGLQQNVECSIGQIYKFNYKARGNTNTRCFLDGATLLSTADASTNPVYANGEFKATKSVHSLRFYFTPTYPSKNDWMEINEVNMNLK